jgi:hypothetical protein
MSTSSNLLVPYSNGLPELHDGSHVDNTTNRHLLLALALALTLALVLVLVLGSCFLKDADDACEAGETQASFYV